jgi:hypothetical protein
MTAIQWAAATGGACLALVGYVVWARWRVVRVPGAFACRVRPPDPVGSRRWPRRSHRGRWVHDVLLVHRGVTLARTEALGVATVDGPVAGPVMRGSGESVVRLRLHLDDERKVDLVVHEDDVPPAFGPFVVAALTWRRRTGTA